MKFMYKARTNETNFDVLCTHRGDTLGHFLPSRVLVWQTNILSLVKTSSIAWKLGVKVGQNGKRYFHKYSIELYLLLAFEKALSFQL